MEEIDIFLKQVEEKYGKLPKMAHGMVDEENKIHYAGPYFSNNELSAAIKALLFGDWNSAGDISIEFENKFSESVNNKYGCFVNSGSSANLLLIAALKECFKWENGDEIIVSPCGFPTTITTIVQNDLNPVFIDIDLNNLNFDLLLIEEKITNKTKAIFLSPVLGSPPNIDKLINICEKYNLKLVLDCCDSLWTEYNQKQLTEYSIASSHSFYPAHIITTLEGGMVTSNNKKIINICKSLSAWGRNCNCYGKQNYSQNGLCNKRFSKWLKNLDTIIDHRYVFGRMGYNLKNLDLCAAIGIEQLKKKEEIINIRKNNLKNIQKVLSNNLKNIYFPTIHSKTNWVPFAVPIICKDKEYKSRLVNHLETSKIQTRNYFAGNILLHPGFEYLDNCQKYPNSNKVLDIVFFIGCSPTINNKNIEYLNQVLKRFDE